MRKIYISVILRSILHRKNTEKKDRNLDKFNPISQKLADKARMILKKPCFSDPEIIETCRPIDCEKYQQDPQTQIKTLNTAKQEPPNYTETQNPDYKYYM